MVAFVIERGDKIKLQKKKKIELLVVIEAETSAGLTKYPLCQRQQGNYFLLCCKVGEMLAEGRKHENSF